MKVCTACGVGKPISDYYVRKRRSGDDVPLNQCKECVKHQVTTRYFANHEASCQRRRELDRQNPERKRDNRLRSQFGITLAEYELLLDGQGGVCAICGLKCPKGNLAVDHDHETGRVRGLLCTRCNPGLGYFRDNVDLLGSAIRYLKENQCSPMVTSDAVVAKAT